jgi:hypothetical protein
MDTMGHSGRPQPQQKLRERLDSFAEMPTDLITLSPAFLDALRKLAPKARSSRLRYVLALAAIVPIGWAVGGRTLLSRASASAAAVASSRVGVEPNAPNAEPPSEAAATNAPSSAPTSPPAAASPTNASSDARLRPANPKPSKVTKNRAKQAPR